MGPTKLEGPSPAGGAKWYEGWRGGEEGDSRRMQWFKVLFPGLFGLAVAASLLLYLPWKRWLVWDGFAFAYLAFAYGKIVIIPLGVGVLHFHPMFVALTVLYVDFLCALFIAWNFPLAKRVPILGRYVSWVESKGAKLMGDHPALRAGAWTGIAFYVMLPVRGTGGITAAVIGRGLGMRASHVVSSISVGTFIAALVLSYATYEGVTLLARNLVIGTMVLLFAVCVVLLGYLAMRLSRIRRWESGGPGR